MGWRSMQREIFCSSSYLLFLFCLLFLDFAYDIALSIPQDQVVSNRNSCTFFVCLVIQ